MIILSLPAITVVLVVVYLYGTKGWAIGAHVNLTRDGHSRVNDSRQSFIYW